MNRRFPQELCLLHVLIHTYRYIYHKFVLVPSIIIIVIFIRCFSIAPSRNTFRKCGTWLSVSLGKWGVSPISCWHSQIGTLPRLSCWYVYACIYVPFAHVYLILSHIHVYVYNQGACLESGAHFVPRPLGCDVSQDIICIDRPIGATIPPCFQKLPQWPPSLAPFRSKYSKHTECYKFRSGKTHVCAYIHT